MHKIGTGRISENIFDLMLLSPKHPTLKKYKQLLTKNKHTKEDSVELERIIQRFRLVSKVSKKYNWKRHPKIGKLAILEINRLLETKPSDWHFNYPVNPKKIKTGQETFKPVEFILNIAEPYNVELENPQEINFIRGLLTHLDLNEKASLKQIIAHLDKKYKRTKKIDLTIQKSKKLPFVQGLELIIAEYIRTHPADIKRLLLRCMPAFTKGMKTPKKMDLITIDKLVEFYGDVFPEFLERHNLKLKSPFEEQVKQLQNMANKKKKLKNIHPVKFRLSPGKTILDNFPGATGQDCIKLDEMGQSIVDPKYHTLQIINLETGKNEGTISVYERTINGEKHLVSTAMQPKARLIRQVKPSELYKSLVGGLIAIGKQKGIHSISSTARRGETSNRGEIDARLKANRLIQIRARRFFPDMPPHKKLYVLSSRKRK